MIELILMGAMLALMMHTGRRFIQHINVEFNLGTLATLTTIQAVTPIDASREQGVFIKKIKGTWSCEGLTDGQGPILCGMTTGISSAALVNEALVADPGSSRDLVAMEQANRRVVPQMVIYSDNAGANGNGIGEQYYRKQYWPFKEIPEGFGLELFAHNLDTVLSVTDPLIRFNGVVEGEWLLD